MSKKAIIIILILAFFIFNFLLVFAYEPLVSLPGLEEMPGESLLAKYLSWLFMFALASAAFLAVLQITIGGIQMIFGGASETARTNAKQRIQDAIWGLVLALGSVLILTTVSTQFKDMTLDIPEITVTVTEATTTTYECSSDSISTITGKRDIIATYETMEECEAGCNETAIGSSYWKIGSSPPVPEYQCRIESVTPPPDGEMGTWKFDSGIEEQKADASDSLKSLLGCMRSLLSSDIGRVSAISDSANRAGTPGFSTCNYCTCSTPGCHTGTCKHTCSSCHYGGGTDIGESQAVDFGDEENKAEIITAATTCRAGFTKDEGTHIHVSTKDCLKK